MIGNTARQTALSLYILLLLAVTSGCAGVATKVYPDADSSATVRMLDTLTLVFAGDVMQHLPQINAVTDGDSLYGYDQCFGYIKPLWEGADFTIANLETTLNAEGRYSGYPQFAAPEDLARSLRDAGVDLLALANNHSLDRGYRGVSTTLRAIDSLGMLSMGVYTDSAARDRTTLLIKDGFRVALLNYTYGTNGIRVPRSVVVNMIDTVQIGIDIDRALRDSATHVIAMFHWGDEYQAKPNVAQRDLALWCRARGVDVVVGSHPHVVQPIDTALRVIYSLGNLVSNQRKRYQDGGINARVTLVKGRPAEIEFLPHWVYTPIERGRRRYYVVPATMAGDSTFSRDSAYVRSMRDSRQRVGAASEIMDI